jgi:hypothetical protein
MITFYLNYDVVLCCDVVLRCCGVSCFFLLLLLLQWSYLFLLVLAYSSNHTIPCLSFPPSFLCLCCVKAHEKASFQFEPLFQVNTASGLTLPSGDPSHAHFGLKSLAFLPKTSELFVSTADNALIYFNM